MALPSDPIAETVQELNHLGRDAGGSAQRLALFFFFSNVDEARLTSIFRYACELSSKEAIGVLAQKISQKEQTLDMLISNSGIHRDPPRACNVLTAPLNELQASMWSIGQNDWEDTFRVNTTAHYFLSVAFLPLLAAAADRPTSDDGKG